jgi:hypothetical protein
MNDSSLIERGKIAVPTKTNSGMAVALRTPKLPTISLWATSPCREPLARQAKLGVFL